MKSRMEKVRTAPRNLTASFRCVNAQILREASFLESLKSFVVVLYDLREHPETAFQDSNGEDGREPTRVPGRVAW